MNDRDLIFAAAHVAHRAPQEWAEFISKLTAYTDARRDECVAAPNESLRVAQGRAQACVALRKLLAECVDTANKIETKQTQKPHRPQ